MRTILCQMPLTLSRDPAACSSKPVRIQIGPLSQEEFLALDPVQRLDIQRVLAGDLDENDSEPGIVPPQISGQISTTVGLAVNRTAWHLRSGVSYREVASALKRQQKAGNEVVSRAIFEHREEKFKLRHRVHERLVHNMSGDAGLATQEGWQNHAEHGCIDPRLSFEVGWSFNPETGELEFHSTDPGDGFNPEALPDPRSPEYWEEANGRGWLLMHTMMHKAKIGNDGPSGKMGTSLEMGLYVTGLDEKEAFVNPDEPPISILDQQVARAVKHIVDIDRQAATSRQTLEETQARQEKMAEELNLTRRRMTLMEAQLRDTQRQLTMVTMKPRGRMRLKQKRKPR